VVALATSRTLHLDPDVLPVDDAYDVGRADRAKTVEMPIVPLKGAAVVPIMENTSEF
jgi:hypothetical protein